MSLRYFGDRAWSNITREERVFCAELYFALRGRERDFVRWLGDRPGTQSLELEPEQPWEAAFEVCFYRDLLFVHDTSVRDSRYSDKRTFDLCLFSPNDIVIIEAKAQAAFESRQLEYFTNDKLDVLQALRDVGRDPSNVRVTLLGLASSQYFANARKYGRGRRIPIELDGHFSWGELDATFMPHPMFRRAEQVYKH